MKCPYQIGTHDVYRFSMPVIDSSMYLVRGERSCLIVDPCVSEEAEALLREWHPQKCLVLLTHEHCDHISGVNWLRDLLPCEVVCSETCAARIKDPKKNLAAYAAALVLSRSEEEQKQFLEAIDRQHACRADRTYARQAELQWEDLTLTLTETPGHSPGSQIIDIGRCWFFTGDSLIPGTDVITGFPGGSKRTYQEAAAPYLETIPSGSIVFPGHGMETVWPAPSDV